MKKAPIVIVGLVLLLTVLLGIMMFQVNGEDDEEGILSAFNTMENNIKRPISVEEVIRQVENLNEEDDSGVNVPTPVNPPGTSGGGSSGGGQVTPGPQDGLFDNEKTVSGVLQYIPQGDWYGNKYLNISALKLGSSGVTVEDAGCYFCSLTMASAFFRGRAVTYAEAEKVCGDSRNFIKDLAIGDSVLAAYSAGVSINGDAALSLNDVKTSINNNKPLIIHFTSSTSAGYYSGSGHFAFCIGYSDNDNALVLYDPGKGEASKDKKLTYLEYSAGVLGGTIYMRSFK